MNNRIVLALVLVGVVLSGLMGMFIYTDTHDKDVQYTADISRLNEGSRSELSNYTLKIGDMVQVPAKYASDLKSVIETYFNGKNSKNDQKAVFAFMQEKIPSFDSKMYEMIMVTMNSGRDAFNNIQKRKIDICENHKSFRNKFWTKQILGEFTPDDEYKVMCRVVSDAKTNKAFETGIQESVKL